MKAATAQEIKNGLKALDAKALAEICLRLSRYKKENKELIGFLLFEADDLPAYIRSVNETVDEAFAEVNTASPYWAKKGLRKALRIANRHIRYAGNKTAEVEILLHYCTNFKGLPLDRRRNAVLANIYRSQLKKIKAAIGTLHEDLQYDYLRSFERLDE